MNQRELGGRTLGCGLAMLIVLRFFYGMVITAEKAARRIKEKRSVQRTQSPAQNLESVAIVINGYVAAHGATFPPMETPEQLRSALVPMYIKDTSVLIGPRDGKPFLPNPVLSEKKLLSFQNRASVIYELGEATPASDGSRAVLFLNGLVRTVSAAEWTTLSQRK